MGNFTKKLIAILLCLAMIGSYMPMAASAQETEVEYTLYPTPHSVAYAEGSFELKDINAIYDEGIDDYTKARLEETAALLGLSVTESETADPDKTNVYVGINGSGDVAQTYINANYTVDAALFDKTDAHFVAANNGEIVVLGKDTDSAFYGLTTLYQIFGQLTGKDLRNLTINDYADVASRGFIEGYYGNPWSVEDRAALMTWGGYYKLNSYFYAPKDDPKHNSKWRELYTEEELETQIRPLAEAGNASKCRFVYALHPYMYNPITDSNYDQSVAIMKAKFAQVIECGVRQIAILADDAGNQGGSHYTRMLTDMTNWLKEMQVEYPDLKLLLPFVTQEYMGYGQSYYRNFPENIQIVMTGGQVWGYCSTSFTNSFYNNVGRGAYLWINWPCSDNSKNHLIMGGYADFLHPGVDPSKVEGIVLNPMQQSEPSKVAIFGNACYTWNIWETRAEADAAWEASFSCVNHKTMVPNDASEAFKELCKHMINQNMTNGVVNLQESVAIKDALSSLKSKLAAGTYTQAQLDSLRAEFVKLQEAAITFRAEGDQRIVNQIVYWMDCWDDTTTAAIAYLDALSGILNGASDTEIWGNYAIGQSAWESSRTHALWYMDHYEYAEVGVQHIVPFMKAVHEYLSNYVLDIVDPSGALSGGSGVAGDPLTLSAFEGNNPSYYSGNLSKIVDGDPSSYLWYSDYGRVGQYVGVDLGRNVLVGNVTFIQDAGDHFSNYTLQYSTDGVNYRDYKNYSDAVLEADLSADGIEARYIRFYNNASTSVWIKLYEISVTEAAAAEVYTNNETMAAWSTRVGNETAELVTGGTATMAPGDYIGFDLRRIKDLDTITVAEQGELTLQVSKNNVDWDTVSAGKQELDGRYVRLINLTDANVTANLTTFTVTSVEYNGPYLLEDNIGVNSSWGVGEDCRENGAAFDGNIGTITEFGDFVSKGQYFIYDLGQDRDIYKLEIYCADSAVNYIRDAEMQISADLENWTTVLTIGDGVENTNEASVTCINSDAGYSQATSTYPNFVSIEGELDEAMTARYIRVIMTANNNERAVVFNEIEINDGEYVSVSNDPTFEISAIEVQGYPPQNMTDGDLTTSWKPDTTEAGYMIYTFSANLDYNRINIVQKYASHAKLSLFVENDGIRRWVDMGTMDDALVSLVCNNDLTLALKIEWDAESVPNITEIIHFNVEGEVEPEPETADKTALNEQIAIALALNADRYTAETWANVEAALAAAQAVAADDAATQEAVDAAAEALAAAIAALEKLPLTDEEALRAAQEAAEAAEAAAEAAANAEAAAEEALAAAEEAAANAEIDREAAEAAKAEAEEAQAAAEAAQAAAEEAQAAAEEAAAAAAANDTAAAAAAAEAAKRAQEIAELYEQVAAAKAEMALYLAQIKDASDSTEEDREAAEAAELACAQYYAMIQLIQFAEDSSVQGEELEAALEAGLEAIQAAETVEAVETALAEAMAAIYALYSPFVDVVPGSFYADPVAWAVENGITNGTSATTFGPNDECMRAHVVTFLWRAAGSPEPTSNENPFTDVKETDFFYKAVLWAVENGITNGLTATTFGPTAYCNRAQVVTFLYRAMGEPEVNATANPFTDVTAGSWYEAPVLWAVENGITNGLSATAFGPESICNRAQIVTFLYRAYAN